LREPPSDKRAQLVLRAFSRLGEKDREILALTAWEGLTPAEIAGVLGMTANRVRVRLHRARAKVRRQLRPATEARRHRAAVAVEPD
jgi:RNA polymerase sigma-70 factor (ECF subfamily)